MGGKIDPEILLRWSQRYLLPVIAALLIGMVYYLGIYSERTGFVEQVLDPGLKRITHPVLNAFRGRPPQVAELRITLTAADLDSLNAWHDRAMEEGLLAPGNDHRLPAEVMWMDRMLSAQISLHPGAANELNGTQWPIAIRLSGPDKVLGMQGFVLREVTDAAPLYGWLLQQALREQGLPTLGSGLSELVLNERTMGLQMMEGLPDPLQLTQWRRGAGPLLRFDKGLLLGSGSMLGAQQYATSPPLQADWLSAPVLAMRHASPQQGEDPALRFTSFARSLDGFRGGQLPPSEVFDMDALARLLALCDLFGAQATISWWNLQFMADSTTGRLLAVPLRCMAGQPIREPLVLRTGAPVRFPSSSTELLGRFFGDEQLYTTYIAHLDTFSTAGWMEDLLQRFAGPFAAQHRIVRSEIPNMEYDAAVLFHDRDVVRAMLHPRDLVLAYTQGEQNGKWRVAVANVHSLPIRVDGAVAGQDSIATTRPMLLWPRERDKPLVYRTLEFDKNTMEETPAQLRIKLIGVDDLRHARIRTWGIFAAN